jgi:Cft2 family RNA processing exonuclease
VTHVLNLPLPQDIQNEPDEIISVKGHTIPRKMSVDEISFSAHVDYSQNSEFIEAVHAQHIVSGHPPIPLDISEVLLEFRFLFMENKRLWAD